MAKSADRDGIIASRGELVDSMLKRSGLASQVLPANSAPVKSELLASFRIALAFFCLFAVIAVLLGSPGPGAVGPVLISIPLAGALSVLSAIDIRHYRLPDLMTLPLLIAGVAVSHHLQLQPWWWSLVSALVGFAVLALIDLGYRRIRGRAGLGLGDAKLLAASGAWLGAELLPAVLLCSAGSAIVCILLASLLGRRTYSATDRIPFGPFLAFGTWIVWLSQPLLSASP